MAGRRKITSSKIRRRTRAAGKRRSAHDTRRVQAEIGGTNLTFTISDYRPYPRLSPPDRWDCVELPGKLLKVMAS